MDNSISIVNKLHLLTKFIEAGQFDESDRKSRKYIGLMIKDLADCVLKSVATTPTPTTPINSATYTNPSLIGAPLPLAPPPLYPGPRALVTSNNLNLKRPADSSYLPTSPTQPPNNDVGEQGLGAPLPLAPPPPYPGPHALVTSNILLRTASPRQSVPPPPDNDEQGLLGFGLRTHDENGATVISENNHNMFGRSRRQCRNCGLIVRLIIPANFPFTLTFKFIQIPLGHSSKSIKQDAK